MTLNHFFATDEPGHSDDYEEDNFEDALTVHVSSLVSENLRRKSSL